MPELPEVETVTKCLRPHLLGRKILRAGVHAPRLRHPLRARDFAGVLRRKIIAVRRRAKYIIIEFTGGRVLTLHLGMTGSFRVVCCPVPRTKHDHLDWRLDNGLCLRYNDPRRFGSAVAERLTVAGGDPPSLAHLGPEPLGDEFSAAYLRQQSRRRGAAVKSFIMDQRVVVGVGNIYASEALFRARISPTRRAGALSRADCARLAGEIKRVLRSAIRAGGTTISDYITPDGKEGGFEVKLQVYGRAGEACVKCGAAVRQKVIGGRSSFYCSRCQR